MGNVLYEANVSNNNTSDDTLKDESIDLPLMNNGSRLYEVINSINMNNNNNFNGNNNRNVIIFWLVIYLANVDIIKFELIIILSSSLALIIVMFES